MKIDGIEVVDSKEDTCLPVTEQDVAISLKKRGKQNCWACAAQTRAEQMPGVLAAAINLSISYLLKGKGKNLKWYRYVTSDALRTEIVSYDRSDIFAPGDYWLKAVPKSMKEARGRAHSLGAPKHGRPGHERRKTAGVRPHAMCGLRTNGHNTIHNEKNKK
jgi:hypothetical protein